MEGTNGGRVWGIYTGRALMEGVGGPYIQVGH